MSRIIIGIHGLGNKPPEKLLKKWWMASLKEGLRASGHPRIFLKFKLVFWADILHPELLNPKEKNEKSPFYINSPYIQAKNYKTTSPSRLRKKLRDYLQKQLDRILLNSDMSLNFTAVTDKIIHHFFRDLDIYYSSALAEDLHKEVHPRQIIRERLERTLKKHRRKNILLIAHSMGSIVAYDVLTQSVLKVEVNTLVTIGSPLGLPLVVSKIVSEQQQRLHNETTVKTPERVCQAWYNLSDLKDKVAIDYSLSDDFAENSHQVKVIDQIIYNNYEFEGKRNPHKVYGYLRTPELAVIVDSFLNSGKSRLRIKIREMIVKIFMKRPKVKVEIRGSRWKKFAFFSRLWKSRK